MDERESYIARVLEAIEKRKYYPKEARRRGVEGEVAVSFCICRDGVVRDLKASGRNPAFNRAAHKAVEKATPFPTPPASAGAMTRIEYRMLFALK